MKDGVGVHVDIVAEFVERYMKRVLRIGSVDKTVLNHQERTLQGRGTHALGFQGLDIRIKRAGMHLGMQPKRKHETVNIDDLSTHNYVFSPAKVQKLYHIYKKNAKIFAYVKKKQ
jgi:hypothetical protein